MVGAVLSIVEFDEEGGALDAIRMGLAAVGGPGPCEADRLEAGATDLVALPTAATTLGTLLSVLTLLEDGRWQAPRVR